MDFTIRLRPDGTAETNEAADAVKRVREELEKTQKAKPKIDTRPRAVREAKEDRELDRAAAKAQREIIKDEREREKAAARKAAQDERRIASEQKVAARQAEIEKRKAETEKKEKARAEAQRVRDDAKKVEQIKKQQEREDKELARAASKAQRDIIRQEKEEAKKAEQAALVKIDPELGLSKIEKTKKRVAAKEEKDKDQARAEKIDPSLREMTKTEKAIKARVTDPIKLGIAGAAVAAGAAVSGLVYKLAPLATGYMGMARLSIISQQASWNMRRLFIGTNPRPLLDAIQRTSQLMDPRTFTGKTLGEFFVRSSNSIFAMLAKMEPYVRLFFKGMLYGALQAEIAWLKIRIAIQPVLNMLPKGIGLMTAFGAGALLVKGAIAVMGAGVALGAAKAAIGLVTFGASAATAMLPLLPFAAAIAAIAAAIYQLNKLMKEWDENSWKQISTKLKGDLGLATKEETEAAMTERQGIVTGEEYDKKHKLGKYAEKPKAGATPLPKDAAKQAAAAGPPIGKSLGTGIVAGLEDTKAKVGAAARGLVLEAESEAKSAAQIKSPARKWRNEIGRNLGEGAALGLEDSAGRVDEAARALIPGAPGGAGGVAGARGSVVIQSIGPFYGIPPGGEQQVRRWVFDAIDDAFERAGALA